MANPSATASIGPLNQVIQGSDYGFSQPRAISSDGTNVWVANYDGDSVTELSESTGALVQVVSGLDNPCAISSDGTNVWVVDCGNGSVTELSATSGAPEHVISGTSDGFDSPDAISSDGTQVWVANASGGSDDIGSVTELSATNPTGQAQVISNLDPCVDNNGNTVECFDDPEAISSDGNHVWVANSGGSEEIGSVTELSATNPTVEPLVISGSTSGIDGPTGISSDGAAVWVANYESSSVTELSASSGAIVHTVSGCGLDYPWAISSDGTNVWVANDPDSGGASVTELSASTGSPAQVISDSSYGFSYPYGISSDGSNVWVANAGTSSVTVFPVGASGSTTGCAPPTTSTPPTSTNHTTTPAPTTTSTPTTTPTGPPRASAAAFHGAVAVAGGTRLTVACTGAGGSCTITATMSVVETLRAGKLIGVAARAKTTHRTVIVGRANIVIPAGRGEHTLLVKLNAAGAILLRSRGRLPVHLRVSSGSSLLASRTVTIPKPAAKNKKKH